MSCLDFDGVNDLCQVASNIGIDGGVTTMGCWVNFQTTPGNNVAYCVFSQANNTSKVGYVFDLLNDAGTLKGRATRAKQGVANDRAIANWTPTTGTWYHVVLRYDGTNIEWFLDGTSQATAASSGNGTNATNNLFTVAKEEVAGGGGNFGDIRVKHMIVYDASLAADRIAMLRQRNPGDNDTNILLHWPFDENTGTTATDHAGAQSNGTITEATWVGDNPPVTYK